MSLKRVLLGIVLVVTSSSLADAGTVNFTNLPFITGGCYFCAVAGSKYGAYEGFVSGTLDGASFNNWISDEFVWDGVDSRSMGIPSGPIEYTLTSFAGPGTDLSSTWADWVGNAQQPYNMVLAKYEQAALLLGGDGTTNLPGFINIDKSNAALVQAYQFALYSIFVPTSTIAYWGFDPTVGGAATALLTQVQNDVANPLPSYSVTYSQLRIYTPTAEGLCHQDFLYWCGYSAEFLQFVGTPRPVASSFLKSSHLGTLTQGQSGVTYMLSVHNGGTAATTGTATVTDTLPLGLRATAISGPGWICTLATLTCLRSDPLPPDGAYPPITLVVNVAPDAPSTVTNQVSLSGGGLPSYNASDATTILAPFADVSSSNAFLPAIDLLREYGITSGCSSSQYCPGDSVTRSQMAVFVVRSIMGGDNFTYTPTPYFNDVPASQPYFSWIQKLRDLGVTSSCGPTAAGSLYCPDDPVTRGQMAVFIIRDRFGSSTAFNYPSAPLFTDVPASNGFFPWIQKMGQIGITAGCGSTAAGPNYCPNDSVTRDQMAVFIMRGAFNQLLPASTPMVVSASPPAGLQGYTITVTLTGQNTNWVNGATQVTTGPGISVTNVVVTSATTLTAQFVIAANAVPGPYSLTTTGGEEATLPNGFTVR